MPVYRHILELIGPIETPKEDTTIKFNRPIRTPIDGRVIKLIGPIGTIKGLVYPEVVLSDL